MSRKTTTPRWYEVDPDEPEFTRASAAKETISYEKAKILKKKKLRIDVMLITDKKRQIASNTND